MDADFPEWEAPAVSLFDCLLQGCHENPNGRCVRCENSVGCPVASVSSDGWLAYAQVRAYVDRLIAYLQSEPLKLTPGKRVAVYSVFRWEVSIVLSAASFLQLPVVLIDAHEDVSFARALLNNQCVSLLFLGQEQNCEELQSYAGRCLLLGAAALELPSQPPTLFSVLQVDTAPEVVTSGQPRRKDSVALIMPTAGMTGPRRVICVTEEQLAQAAHALAPLLQYTSSDVVCFLTYSIFHPFFIVHILLLFRAGGAFGAELQTLDNIRKMRTTVLVGPGAILSTFYELLRKEGEKLRGLARRIFALLVEQPPLNQWDPKAALKSTRTGIARSVMRSIRDLFVPQYRLTVSGISRLAEDTRLCLERLLLEPVLDVYGPSEWAGVCLARTRKREHDEWFCILSSPFNRLGRLSTLMRQGEHTAYGELHLHINGKWTATGDLFRFIMNRGPSDPEAPQWRALAFVDRISKIVLCAEHGANELDTSLVEPIELSPHEKQPPFLSLSLMERASQRSAFVRQCWISFEAPQRLMVLLVPVRDMVWKWLRMRQSANGTALVPSRDALSVEPMRDVCNDALFQEAVVCDLRRVLVNSRAIRDEWFDALSWEIYFEPQLDAGCFDLGFTPRNRLLTPSFELRTKSLRAYYGKELGIPVPRASLERGALLAEQLDEEGRLSESSNSDEFESDIGDEPETATASSLQRWLLTLWSALRADLVDPVLNADEECIEHRSFWGRIFHRQLVTSDSAERATTRSTRETSAGEAASTSIPRTDPDPDGASKGPAPAQEIGWIARFWRSAGDPGLSERPPVHLPRFASVDADLPDGACLPLLHSTRNTGRRQRQKAHDGRLRSRVGGAASGHSRWRLGRLWNTLVHESPDHDCVDAGAATQVDRGAGDGADMVGGLTASGASEAAAQMPRWRRWLHVPRVTASGVCGAPQMNEHMRTIRKGRKRNRYDHHSAESLSISDSEIAPRFQRPWRKFPVQFHAAAAGRIRQWWTGRDSSDRHVNASVTSIREHSDDHCVASASNATEQGVCTETSSNVSAVDSLSENYQGSMRIQGLP